MKSDFSKYALVGALLFLLLLVAAGIFVIIYLTVTASDRIDLAGAAAFIEGLAGLSALRLLRIYRKEREWEKSGEILESIKSIRNSLSDEKFKQLVEDTIRRKLGLLENVKEK